MNKDKVYNELKNVWGLNENTTDESINNFYNCISSEYEGITIEDKKLYCYEVAINSMIRDYDLEEELGTEIYNEIKENILKGGK